MPTTEIPSDANLTAALRERGVLARRGGQTWWGVIHLAADEAVRARRVTPRPYWHGPTLTMCGHYVYDKPVALRRGLEGHGGASWRLCRSCARREWGAGAAIPLASWEVARAARKWDHPDAPALERTVLEAVGRLQSGYASGRVPKRYLDTRSFTSDRRLEPRLGPDGSWEHPIEPLLDHLVRQGRLEANSRGYRVAPGALPDAQEGQEGQDAPPVPEPDEPGAPTEPDPVAPAPAPEDPSAS